MMPVSIMDNLKGILLFDEPMDKHTSWRIGGVAEQFYTPADIDDLALFMAQLPSTEKIFFIGLGSNLLVRDKGFRGTIISLKGSLNSIDNLDGHCLRIGAGTSCAKLARYCHHNHLIGGEFFAGIPGLLGGALAMNAGAFGADTWSFVKSVVTIDNNGIIRNRLSNEYEVTYRYVKQYPYEWFISAELQFQSGDGDAAALRIKNLMEQRANTQPIGLPSCGSVFKNPHNCFAAKLIEKCGLKGFSIGGAVVSEKHANFIINRDNAKAIDVEALIQFIQTTVKKEQQIELFTEVQIIGDKDEE